MPIKILMPALSPTMTEGTLAKWCKQEGDMIESGDVIAEIETDKATMEVEAVDEGKLVKILVSEGTAGVQVNELIAVLLEEDEDDAALDGFDLSGGATSASAAPAETVAEAAPAVEQSTPNAPQAQGSRIFSSPLARRLAGMWDVDLASISGSGPNGRIVKRDVEAARDAKASAPATATAPASPATAPMSATPAGVDAKAQADMLGMGYREEAASGMRKTISRRLTEAKQTVPHFYLTIDCEIDALLEGRKRLNAKQAEAGTGIKLSVNDFIIKASALALRQVPAANASWAGDSILYYDDVDISVAVATDGGLITPIVKTADKKGLSTISDEVKDLAKRARDNKLKPEEFQGGTFSISNLGMYGIKEFSAIINPPQGAILAVGAGEQRPVVKNGELTVATVMTCTLSVDHRVVDGAVGAQFMAAFKRLIEDPLSMLM